MIQIKEKLKLIKSEKKNFSKLLEKHQSEIKKWFFNKTEDLQMIFEKNHKKLFEEKVLEISKLNIKIRKLDSENRMYKSGQQIEIIELEKDINKLEDQLVQANAKIKFCSENHK